MEGHTVTLPGLDWKAESEHRRKPSGPATSGQHHLSRFKITSCGLYRSDLVSRDPKTKHFGFRTHLNAHALADAG